jgi:multidrug efflux pump subunit AcrB
MLVRLLQNHVFANLTFVLILAAGALAYILLPREQDPSITFNWVQITTAWPGASAEDVEKLITEPLEEAVRTVQDIRFASSTSRPGMSTLLVRFQDLSERDYDRRISDLRREVQAEADQELPIAAEEPEFFELTSANMFPAALIVVSGAADDEILRRNAKRVQEDLERLAEVESVSAGGLHDPELKINFSPEDLANVGVTPIDLANTVSAYLRDMAAGSVRQGEQQWLVRLIGMSQQLDLLAQAPLHTNVGPIPMERVATLSRGREKPAQLVRYNGKPAVLLVVSKKAKVSSLVLLKQLKSYLQQQQNLSSATGVELVLVDDQTPRTRRALRIMENNALLGLLLVILTTWIFLGGRLAFFIGIGIPFTLAGTFGVLFLLDQSLNIAVFLGIVIALGMLVDDAVVVMEAIHYRLQQGMASLAAVMAGLAEVAAPVVTAVMTTMAAFLPLLLTPGLLGKFMFMIPLVVTVALGISLIEALWMLPTHIANGVSLKTGAASSAQDYRRMAMGWLRINYTRLLLQVLRRPTIALVIVVVLFTSAIGVLGSGLVRTDFFATDPIRLFYVNIEMPPSTSLQDTLQLVQVLEAKIKRQAKPGELRETVGYAGLMFTENGLVPGDQYGQLAVSLHPHASGLRSVGAMIEGLRDDLLNTPGPVRIFFVRRAAGPPATKPINVKVRGDDFSELRQAVAALEIRLQAMPGVKDISNDDVPGKLQLNLRLDGAAIQRAGLDPMTVVRTIRLLLDGEVVASFQDQGEKVDVRVQGRLPKASSLNAILDRPIALSDGGDIALRQLVHVEKGFGAVAIQHYKFRRSITVEADIDKVQTSAVVVNQRIQQEWETLRRRFPGVDLDFSGVFEDIQEGLQALATLFVLGIAVIYLILATQFGSYWQPLMILASVPMAFSGVVFGLLLSQHPLSLYTLYGVVALTGIAVNTAIVLIVAANDRLKRGMSVTHATVYAARRRLTPILITTLTTMAGLFSLAIGLGGKSLLWGPVASAIVWGLGFSSVLTLFVIPVLYRIAMGRRSKAVVT